MSSGSVLILGAVAGLTIFLGLPLARLKHPAPRLKVFLNALAIGILVFLLWDVLSNGWQPVVDSLAAAQHARSTWLRFAGLAAAFSLSLAFGLLGLVYYDRWMSARSKSKVGGTRFGPGAAAVDEFAGRRQTEPAQPGAELSPAKRLAFFIALGIGLHNFSEGLAIGQSAAKNQISLALMLIIGFGLHNATEGAGIVAPLAAESVPPSWGFLAALGLLGGAPTFFGTIIGRSFVNEAVFTGFLSLAAGSILYVVIQLLNVARRQGHPELLMWGLLTGLFAGFATDLVLHAAGA